MKKIVLLASLLISTSAFAITNDDCERLGGICVGSHYCRSEQKMNWWSAWSWCESLGANLITLEDDCPSYGTGGSTGSTICSDLMNLGDTSDVWTKNVLTNALAYNVALDSGQVSSDVRISIIYYALCK